jgi:hypothetical protein
MRPNLPLLAASCTVIFLLFTSTIVLGQAGAGENAGNNKPVSITGLSLSGGDKDDYTVNNSATTTAGITLASLTITADTLSVPVQSSPALSDKFSVKVLPSVSQDYKTVNVQPNTAEAFEIKVYDITGRQIEMTRGGLV